jgi:hypothetical protein
MLGNDELLRDVETFDFFPDDVSENTYESHDEG